MIQPINRNIYFRGEIVKVVIKEIQAKDARSKKIHSKILFFRDHTGVWHFADEVDVIRDKEVLFFCESLCDEEAIPIGGAKVYLFNPNDLLLVALRDDN